MSKVGLLIPLVGVVIGYGLKFLTDLMQARWNASKDRAARDELRKEKRYERRSAFQRETLLGLQDATMDLGRTTGRAHHSDIMARRSGTPWRKTMLTDELDEAHRLALARTSTLASRVDDAEVRDLVRELKAYSAETLGTNEEAASSRAMLNMAVAHERLQEKIGVILRKIDQDSE